MRFERSITWGKVAQVVNNLIQAKVGHRDSGNGVVWLLKRKLIAKYWREIQNSNQRSPWQPAKSRDFGLR